MNKANDKREISNNVTIPSKVAVKNLSPPTYMMNYLTVSSVLRIIVIIYNEMHENNIDFEQIAQTK